MISLYLPGTSPIHRAPAWLKLLVLALGAIVLSLLPNSWGLAAAAFLLPALGYAAAGLSVRIMVRDLRAMLLLVVFLVGTQLIFSPPLAAVCNTARVLAVVLLAQVLTRTTRVQDMVEVAQTCLRPLRRVGVSPTAVGLAMALAITSIGQVAGIVTQVRQAQRSRGVRLAPWAWVMPVLVQTLRHADDVGDALQARGAAD